ncbi:hypothetical protein APHAL10511_007642 [Amanita phalloides]|nr:hypothetical protein APHAL10511_007642 [Amanita phalloides]
MELRARCSFFLLRRRSVLTLYFHDLELEVAFLAGRGLFNSLLLTKTSANLKCLLLSAVRIQRLLRRRPWLLRLRASTRPRFNTTLPHSPLSSDVWFLWWPWSISLSTRAAYLYLVVISLVEAAFASWLLLQYHYNHNYPRVETRTGTYAILFSACWTTVTAGAYALLFIEPTWSTHSVASVGAQAIWVFFTWLSWIISSGLIDASVPSALVKARCAGVVYCLQIQLMFAFSVVQTLSLTAALGVLAWVIWQSTRGGKQGGQDESSADWS